MVPSVVAARAAIVAGTLRGPALADLILSISFLDRDRWIDEVLGFEDIPPDVPDLPRGSVPYLPCPVDDVVAMVRDVPVREHDTVVDLGSGVGRALILAHLLSGAHAHGVEIQEPLVVTARARCAALALTRVSFAHANVVDRELDGSIFFLYAPFNGAMLAAVLGRVEEALQKRPIVVCAVGLELHVPWLAPRPTTRVSLTLYDGKRSPSSSVSPEDADRAR